MGQRKSKKKVEIVEVTQEIGETGGEEGKSKIPDFPKRQGKLLSDGAEYNLYKMKDLYKFEKDYPGLLIRLVDEIPIYNWWYKEPEKTFMVCRYYQPVKGTHAHLTLDERHDIYAKAIEESNKSAPKDYHWIGTRSNLKKALPKVFREWEKIPVGQKYRVPKTAKFIPVTSDDDEK
jgi:hypothetical protein